MPVVIRPMSNGSDFEPKTIVLRDAMKIVDQVWLVAPDNVIKIVEEEKCIAAG